MPRKPKQPAAGDPIGEELAERIKTTELLLRGLRYDFGQQLARAQDGGEEPPPAERLAVIKQLERDLENDRAFEEARRLTRRPPA